MMAFKVRFPLLLLLGVVFLALVCASAASAISSHEGREGLPPRHRESGGQRERAHQEGEREEERRYQPRHHKSQSEEQEEDEEEERHPHHHRPQHKREEDEGRQPRHQREREEEDEEDDEGQQHYRPRHQREREDEDEDEDEEREHGAGRRHRRSRQHAGEREEEQRPSRHRGRGREEDEEEDRRRPEERERRRRSRESERHRGGRQRRSRESEEDDDEEEGSSQDRKNPFLLRSNRFQTLLKNENGQIRLLQRFDKRSNLFENLQNYRLLEYRSKPNTLLLPQHYDADFILVVLRGKAILTVVNPKERNSFNLERGDAIKIPAGTLAYLANRDNEEDLRVVDLAIPVNRPGQFQPFYPSSSENQQSYFRGFSKDILEASFNTNIEEIERVLLQEQQQEEQSHGQRRGRKERHQQQQQEGQDHEANNNNPIVRVSREQIEELSKNAKSSSKKKSESSKSEPFNLRSRDPIYSNKFGQFFQITPKQSPQLKDLDLYLTSVQINEGALLLPHYNSRGTVILVINEGKGNIELVGVRNEQQQQHQQEQQQQEEEEDEEDEDDQRSRQVKRYRARVSPGDVFIVPSSHPVAIKASSNLSFVGFGINAENNQRNFLAGEEDNVISQIHKPVKELAFPGSAQDVDKLIKNQKQSYFANAQPEQKEGQKRSRGPLSSILGAFY